jgi:hypothetical protein
VQNTFGSDFGGSPGDSLRECPLVVVFVVVLVVVGVQYNI